MEEVAQFSISKLIEAVGGRFSTQLGIDLESKDAKEVSKWFLAAILFGARIGETIAINTYKEFARRRVTTPKALLKAGWNGLVEILDAGGYVRYDFKTATKLLGIADNLVQEYQGDLNLLHDRARDPRDLEGKLLKFKGVGPVTVNIFLRELRGVWGKAEPIPSGFALLAARNLGLIGTEPPAHALAKLKSTFKQDLAATRSVRFSDFESALIRLGMNWCRREKHDACPVREYCLQARVERS